MNAIAPKPRAVPIDPLLGAVIDRKYRVLSLVAEGGMGRIYRAEQIGLGRVVALKVLHLEPRTGSDVDPQFQKRFLREASILARLQHPNIVTVFDYGAIEGGDGAPCFMAMEFLSGKTLARRLAEPSGLSTEETIRITQQIARGLAEAHAHGVVHRDLKPSNVMLVPDREGEDRVKIVDFGIVKVIGDAALETEELTRAGSFVGSPRYMAPEQIGGVREVDARTDVYALGVILYECLTGRVPIDGGGALQTLLAQLSEAPRPLRERALDPYLPEWLERLVTSCLEKAPERRPQSIAVVARALAGGEGLAVSSVLPVAARAIDSSPTLSSASSSGATFRGRAEARSFGGIPAPGMVPSVLPVTVENGTMLAPPAESRARTKRTPLVVVALALAAASLIGLAAAVVGARASSPPPQAAIERPPSSTFTLRIESVPPGASVRDGERLLGLTPLEITAAREGGGASNRVFTLTKDGFMSYSLAQGGPEGSDRVLALVPLVPAAALPSASAAPVPARRAPPRAAPGVPATGQAPTAPPPATRVELDIRLSR